MKFVKVAVTHEVGDTGWIRISNKYSTKENKCPACTGEGTLKGADNKKYTCPRCHGVGKLPKGTQCGYHVVQAEVVGMMLQDVQIGIETTGTQKVPRIIFDMKYDVASGNGYRYHCTQQIFETKEEAEGL